MYRLIRSSIFLLALLFHSQSVPFSPIASDEGAKQHGPSAFLEQKQNLRTEERPGNADGSNRPHGSYSSSARQTSLTVPYQRCICDENGAPVDKLEELKHYALFHPHPMFLLSEMAEKLHQYKVCEICPDILSRQTENDIITSVKTSMLNYLNNNLDKIDIEHCPPRYNITYNPKHYPRYLVEIVCSAPSRNDHIEEALSCSYCSLNKHLSMESGICTQYIRSDMPYLTNDPHEPGCVSTDNPPIWHRCVLDVGAGCKCSP